MIIEYFKLRLKVITEEGTTFFILIRVVMLVALAISHLLMPAALTLQDYHYLCQWLVRNINKNPINMSFSLVETRVPREKPLQAKLRADYFSLSLFLYLQCLKKN